MFPPPPLPFSPQPASRGGHHQFRKEGNPADNCGRVDVDVPVERNRESTVGASKYPQKGKIAQTGLSGTHAGCNHGRQAFSNVAVRLVVIASEGAR